MTTDFSGSTRKNENTPDSFPSDSPRLAADRSLAPEDPLADGQQMLDPEVQGRLWIRALIPLLQLRSHEPDPSNRVQFAFDRMHVAACERIARILRSDLGSARD
jgi:hypothetical protein